MNKNSNSSENGIDDKKIYGAGQKADQECLWRIEDACAKYQKVHEEDIGEDDP